MITGRPQRPRRRDLAVGRIAAAVLGDDDLYAVLLEQRAVVGLGERPARGDVVGMRHGERRIDADRRCGRDRNAAAPRRRAQAACGRARETRGVATRRAPAPRPRPYRPRSNRRRLPLVQGARLSASNGTPAISAARAALAEMVAGIRMRGVDQRIDLLGAKDRRRALPRRRIRRASPARLAARGRRCGRRATASRRDRGGRPALQRAACASAVPPRMRICLDAR